MLIFSRDEALVGLLVARSGTGTSVSDDLTRFASLLNAARADAIVIDCDDHVRGRDALKVVGQSQASRVSPCIAIVNGQTHVADAQDLGAWHVIEKSRLWNSPGAIEHWLETTRRREHERFAANVPATVDCGEVLGRQARIVNISRAGACVEVTGAQEFEDYLALRTGAFHVRCEVVWREPSGRIGVRFVRSPFRTDGDLRTALKA